MTKDEDSHGSQENDSRSLPGWTADLATPAPLIGRDGECRAISQLLSREAVRLLTLTGTGGVGKTRLALAVSHQLRETYTHGVSMIALAAIRVPELVLPTIAQELGIQSGSRPILEILEVALRDKRLLLLLDNFEQVIGAAPSLLALLSTCPDLTLLITSRESLNVRGEYVFSVSTLPVPDPSLPHEIPHWLENPSVALFVERAHAIEPNFGLTEANARAVAQICLRLEGLPLALELAAAQIKLLSPQALLARLTHCLPVLTRGYRDAPPRQQTLRTTIQWSYDLLSASQQMLLRRFSTFVGGCSMDALEGLYRELGQDQGGMLDDLCSLLDKNLIQREKGEEEEPRLLMLETIREFGLEAALASGELEQVKLALTRYYLCWAQRARAALFGPEQRLWIKRFVQEQGNLRTVMNFVIESHDQEAAYLLGATLGPFWFTLGTSSHHYYLIEGNHFLEQVLTGSEYVMTRERGWSLAIYGELLAMRGESNKGECVCQQGLALCRQMDDWQGSIASLWMLEDIYRLRGDYRAARQVIEEAMALSKLSPERCTVWGGTWTRGFSLHRGGRIALWDGRYQQARELLLEGRALCQEAGDVYVALLSTLFLGEVACFEGKADEARAVLEQSIVTLREWNMSMLLSKALGFCGLLAIYMGNLSEADTLLSESLLHSRAVGDDLRQTVVAIWYARVALANRDLGKAYRLLSEAMPLALKMHLFPTTIGLETLACVLAVQGDSLQAAQLFGLAERLREVMGAPIPPLERTMYEEQVAVVREALGEVCFHAVWAQGRTMEPEQVLIAQEIGSVITPSSHSSGRVTSLLPRVRVWGLTPREVDVLQLVAQGLTNKEIAERLVLRVVTVNSYLRMIYSKLGVTTRTAAARFAIDHRLV